MKTLFKETDYKFTTKDRKDNEVQDYKISCYNLKEAKKYAKEIIANSKCNEFSNTRITKL